MTSNIAYFSNQFADSDGHGNSRYARELYGAIQSMRAVALFPAAAWTSLTDDRLKTLQSQTSLRILPSGRRGTSLGWTFLHAPPLEWMMPGRVDLTHAVALGYPVCTRKPLVVTVHDLGPLTHPELFSNSRPWLMRRALAQAVREAAAIVCISEATATEVRAYCGGAVGDRIKVVHSGVSEYFFEEDDSVAESGKSLLPNGVPFILSAGKISPRKNIDRLIQAFRLVHTEVPHHLVLIGGDGWDTESVRKELSDPRIASRVHLVGYVSDDVLRTLYRGASVYVHASLFEGFGLTVLEAMAGGSPVITSNISSLPEVAGDAAILVNPMSKDELAAAIVRVCNDDALAKKMRLAGIRRARDFTWAEAARKMVGIYQEALGR